MIQRIQSVFLFIISILMLLLLYSDIWVISKPGSGEIVTMNAFQIQHFEKQDGEKQVIETQNSFYIAILAVLSAGIALFSVFKYKNRMLQLKLGLLNTLLMVAIIGIIIYFVYDMEEMLPDASEGTFGIGIFYPAICLILNWLANRFIRKDEQLVRSSERFRD